MKSLYCLLTALVIFAPQYSQAVTDVEKRVVAEGELAPLPEAKDLLIEIAAFQDSLLMRNITKGSRTLQMMRERLRTSLFHLNLVFEVENEEYPYEPPFREPFPFRPTLEALDEADRFFEILEKTTGLPTVDIRKKIAEFPHFQALRRLLPLPVTQPNVTPLTRKERSTQPVDSYVTLSQRLIDFGENAQFPEMKNEVNNLLVELSSEEINEYRRTDSAFDQYAARAINVLKQVSTAGANGDSRLYSETPVAFPYRRTIQAINEALMVLDVRERLKYPEGVNWHDVELSWFHGHSPKLLQLYHFNRYKYQLFGLLADPEVVLMPTWGEDSFETLLRMRSAPLFNLGTAGETHRIDRHHNTPTDERVHDENHVRRMWGYDKQKQKLRGAVTRQQKIAIYREQETFVNSLLEATKYNKNTSPTLRERFKLIRTGMFETFHETARPADRESLLYDLTRKPGTRQPFEVQLQSQISKANLEKMRKFDGNLLSGANELALNLHVPTVVKYFWDRAPGFLANWDNKLRWGFFDSVFNMAAYIVRPGFRTPRAVAEAATTLFKLLNAEPPPMAELVRQINDRSGQPELWGYFGPKDYKIITVSGIDALGVPAGEIHENWRRTTLRNERWMLANLKLLDGSMVTDDARLQLYFDEKRIPKYLQHHFKFDIDPLTGTEKPYANIRNLPQEFLPINHQAENIMSGAKGITAVDRIWQKKHTFRNLDEVERWLVAAAQTVHQAVLDRNANGARDNPDYNVHWFLLPPINQRLDLELVRVTFEARLKLDSNTLHPEQITMIREGILRLQRKILAGEPIRSCSYSLSAARNEKIKTK